MTKDEASKQLQRRLDLINSDYYDVGIEDYAQALEVAIEALKAQVVNMPSELPSKLPSGDVISRQAAIDALTNDWDGMVTSVFDLIGNLPSAQPDKVSLQKFTEYQIDWLTSHCDLELEQELEEWVVRFLRDTAECYEELPSAQPEQPKIIRCMDCKYVGTDATCCLVCDREGMGLKPFHVQHDDFCSYAERRTDAAD